jgi:hypothetical protein
MASMATVVAGVVARWLPHFTVVDFFLLWSRRAPPLTPLVSGPRRILARLTISPTQCISIQQLAGVTI